MVQFPLWIASSVETFETFISKAQKKQSTLKKSGEMNK